MPKDRRRSRTCDNVLDKENVGSRQFNSETRHRQRQSQLTMSTDELGCQMSLNQSVYQHASAIFSYLVNGSSGIPPHIPLELSPDILRRTVYELAYGTWRYRRVMEGILEDSDFFFKYFHLREKMSLLLVMLFDFQQKKFHMKSLQLSSNDLRQNTVPCAVDEISDALLSHKTKLNAALARLRVRADSRDVAGILPEGERNTALLAQSQPLCVRINTLKTDSESIVRQLEGDGWNVQDDGQDIPIGANSFLFDPVCLDTLLFSAESKAALYCSQFVQEGKLVIEDKVDAMLTESVGHLIAQGDKVIVTCVGNGGIVCRLAALMNNTGRIYSFEALPDEIPKLKDKMKQQGVTNVFLLSECFTGIHPDDPRFLDVAAVIIVPPSTNSTVINPVDYLMIHGDEELGSLPGMSNPMAVDSRIPSLSAEQKGLVTHTLLLSQVQVVFYCTRSMHYAETEAVVESAMDTCCQFCTERNDAIEDKRDHIKHFQLYVPDLVYAMQPQMKTKVKQTKAISNDNALKVPILDLRKLAPSSPVPAIDNYLTVEPSVSSDGCFLAILQRIPKSSRVPTPPRDVLRRAVAKGLLTDLDYLQTEASEATEDSEGTSEDQKPTENKGSKKGKGRMKRRPSSSLTQLTEAAKNRMAVTKAKLHRQSGRTMHDRPFRM